MENTTTMTGDDFAIDLKTAASMMKMPQHTVLKCIRYIARPNGQMTLPTRSRNGENWFSSIGIRDYLNDLSQQWVASKVDERPAIPAYFKDYLRLETRLQCGVCGKPHATEFAHIDDYYKCLHHHPWNLLFVCAGCHTGYDVEKRITYEEMRWAKSRAEADFAAFLDSAISAEKLLTRLKKMSFPINGVVANGIDFLISVFRPKDKYLEITKVRLVMLLKMLGTGEMNADPEFAFIRFLEQPLSILEISKVCDPFWDEVAPAIYDDKYLMDKCLLLNLRGEELFECLMDHAEKFVDLEKYTDYSHLPARELIEQVAAQLQEEQDYFHRRDRVLFYELDSFTL